MTADIPIDPKASDSLSVAPDTPPTNSVDEKIAADGRQSAGQDRSIARRLQKNPGSEDARLDNALDESMDASDPIAQTQPGADLGPAPSSGFDAEAERQRDA